MLQNKLPIWSCHKGDLVFPHISPKWIRPAVSIPLCWNTKFAVGTRAPKPGSWRSCLHPLFLIGEPGWQYTWNLVHMEQWPTWLIDGCWFFASTKKWSSRLSEVTSSIVDEAYTIQPFISFHWHLQEWLLMIRRQLDDERNLHIQQETRPQTVKKNQIGMVISTGIPVAMVECWSVYMGKRISFFPEMFRPIQIQCLI